MKELIKKLIPTPLLKAIRPYYHGLISLFAHWYFGSPSKKITVIGITGTSGKSTTINALAHILDSANKKTGFITTANYSLGKEIFTNTRGLSMPSGWTIAGRLKKMIENGCELAIVECTSEGLAQNRHLGISFFANLITNLTPAHLEAHGGFDRYQSAKAKLFHNASQLLGVNLDDENTKGFLNFPSTKKFGVSIHQNTPAMPNVNVYRANVTTSEIGLSFELENIHFNVGLMGLFNVYNCLMAIATARELGVSFEIAKQALQNFSGVKGRMEIVPNHKGIKIVVDYAPEPAGMESALSSLRPLAKVKLIHVFGSTGGHRDVSKRFEFGEISARYSDTIIITNDDVYDSDPAEIAKNVEDGINKVPISAKRTTEVLTILDRRAAINKAITIAKPGDLVIITGKGSEQFLVLPGDKKIAWDDSKVVTEELNKLT